VDDDLVSRVSLKSLIEKSGRYCICGIFGSAVEALVFLEKEKPDVLFVDIDMPNTSGLELRRKASEIPVCVFVTDHAEFAAESFELNTLDFLSKPVDISRFRQTTERIAAYIEILGKAEQYSRLEKETGEYVRVTENYRKVSLNTREIAYLEAMKDYSRIVTRDKTYTVISGLGSLLEDERFHSFVRIHRSFAVQKSFVEKVGGGEISLVNGKSLPIGRTYRENVELLF